MAIIIGMVSSSEVGLVVALAKLSHKLGDHALFVSLCLAIAFDMPNVATITTFDGQS